MPAGAPRRGVPWARSQHLVNAAMTLGAADKAKKKAQESWRKKDREVHDIAQVNVRVPIRHKAVFKQFGDLLRKGESPREAFAGAFPGDYAALLRAAKQRNQE